MLPALLLLAAFLVATAVHELGHLLAAKARRTRVVRLAVGRGPRLTGFRSGGVEYVLALLPMGGRLEYERPVSGTANAVIAVGGAVANLAFGFGLFLAAAFIVGVDRMPFAVPGSSPLDYAVGSTAAWLRAVPRGLVDLIAHGDPGGFAGPLATLRRLLLAPGAAATLHVVAALSIAWAVLNMIPVPGLGTDGWQFLVSLRDALRGKPQGAANGSRPRT